MDAKNFELLMRAVKGKDQADIRGEEVKQVLKELLRGEFAAGVKETRFKVMVKKPETGGCAAINKVDGRVNLWINPENWENDPGFVRDGNLRDLIRHELLHEETGLDDDDPLFKLVAEQRGIGLWRRLR